MNFLSMKYFSTVAQEKSFTKAARKLYITQQTLSAHIAAIEKELGSQLILRTVPLELTYAGEVFLTYALDIQKKIENMEYEFKDILHEEKGKLRIGITFTRGRVIMPELIAAFQKLYPKIEIHLIEDFNDVLYQKLLEGEIDLFIGNFTNNNSNIILEEFYNEEMVLLIADTLLEEIYKEKKEKVIKELEQQDISSLEGFPFLASNEKDIAGRIGLEILAHKKITPTIKATSSNIETLLALCTRGVGACFCPENFIKDSPGIEDLSKLKIFRFGKEAQYSVHFVYLKRVYQWSFISKFISLSKNIKNS